MNSHSYGKLYSCVYLSERRTSTTKHATERRAIYKNRSNDNKSLDPGTEVN